MKHLTLSILAALAMSLTLVSCNKDEDFNPTPTPTSDNINYLVMYFAVGGGNLDDGQMANIVQALSYGSTDKVKMTFQYKLSAPFQQDEKFKNFDGTRRFTTDQNVDLKGWMEKDELPKNLNAKGIEIACNAIISDRIGDSKYVMATDTELTYFINWSIRQYPKAKNLILILGNHGGGWNLKSDGKQDYTKSIESDDNIKGGPTLTAKAVQRAVAASDAKRLKMIYTDACLMSVHENYETYAKVTDYALAAVEYTPGIGGNYYELLERLNGVGPDDESLWNFSKSYIDFLNNEWWPSNQPFDLGIFDLRKNGDLTAVCKSIGESLVSYWNNNTPITPSSLLGYDRWIQYIRHAVSRCELCVYGTTIDKKYVPSVLVPFLESEKIYPDENDDYDENEILKWLLGDSESIENAKDQYPDEVLELEEAIECGSHEEFSLPDLLNVLNNTLKEEGLADAQNPFIQLRADYISTLKNMSYINCTMKTSETDYAYCHCSPGIFLFTFNPESWNKGWTYYYKYKDLALEDAINYYSDSDFNKSTSWVNFLKLNDVTPSLLTNPTRDKK